MTTNSLWYKVIHPESFVDNALEIVPEPVCSIVLVQWWIINIIHYLYGQTSLSMPMHWATIVILSLQWAAYMYLSCAPQYKYLTIVFWRLLNDGSQLTKCLVMINLRHVFFKFVGRLLGGLTNKMDPIFSPALWKFSLDLKISKQTCPSLLTLERRVRSVRRRELWP